MRSLGAVILAAGLVIALLPGAALMSALGVRSSLFAAALAPTATIGVLLLVAMLTGLLGLPFSAWTVAVVVVVLLGVGGFRLVRDRPVRRRWLGPRIPGVLGAVLVLVGTGLAVRTWTRGLDGLGRIPQEHDMIAHQLVVAWIARTGRAAPWQVQALDLLTGSPVAFYPDGAHLVPGLLAGLGPDPVEALNAMTVVYLAVLWVVSAALLTAVTVRRLGFGRTLAWPAAGVAAVVAPALYRPVFQLMHDGGILPTAVVLTLTPGLLAAMLLVAGPRPVPGVRPVAAAVAIGVAAAGIVAVHPSAAVTVGLSLVAWLLGDLVTRDGRRGLRRAVPVLLGAGLVGALAALPVLRAGGGSVGGVGAFPPDSDPLPFGDALGSALGLTYGGYLDPLRDMGQGLLTALYLAGVLVVARTGRGLGIVVAWALWVAITFTAMLSPGRGIEARVTGFFYNALLRVWSHVELFVPTLAAIAVVLVSAAVVRAVRRGLPAGARGPVVVTALVAVVAAVLVAVPVRSGTATNTRSVAERYAAAPFQRVSPDDLAAIGYLRDRVRPGQRVMNSANDGSTFLYVEAGVPVVNVASLGTAAVPYTVDLLCSFRDYPTDPAIRAELRRLDVGWVYVDTRAPSIGAAGAPAGGCVDRRAPFTVPPGLTGLDEPPRPGLTLEYRSGSVSVYRLDLDRIG